ncbi:MAG: hypothetical protein ACT4SY_13265 [Hyphomicrobiales bacterium]
MSLSQPDPRIMSGGEAQPDLFGSTSSAPKAYVPKPQHVRNRFIDFLAQMTASETWPWDENQVEFYRQSAWPYLYEKLGDADEAAEWRRRLEAEAARLDAAAIASRD